MAVEGDSVSLFNLVIYFILFLLTIVYSSDPFFCQKITGKRRQDSGSGGRGGIIAEAVTAAARKRT